MLLNVVWLLVGLVLILMGANWLTDGSGAVARRMGVSDLMIGLTVVALGTSAPELVITIMGALSGNAALAIGNVVGSNIFNVLVIVGVVALVRPIVIGRSVMNTEIPLTVMAAFVMLVMSCGPQLDGDAERVITRVDGILLLMLFLLFMRYTFATAKHTDADEAAADPAATEATQRTQLPTWKAALMIVGGLAALIFGGEWFVDGASGVASALGVSDAVIGLTIVAAGTSLPELATSVVAARKGATGIALGNVIGSSILNIFLILGVGATVKPLTFGGVTMTDLLVMTASAVAFWVFGWFFKERTITRWEGALLVAGYVAYTTWLITSI